MFERFTERARKVVVLAQEEARHFNHNYIGTEHLLLGLLREDEGVAARALSSLNVTLDEVREQVESIVGYGEEGTGGQAPFTSGSKKVLELALREALQLGHHYIGTEHILLGLVRKSEGVAARVLSNLGIDPEKVRHEVIRMLDGDRSQRDRSSEADDRVVDAKQLKALQFDRWWLKQHRQGFAAILSGVVLIVTILLTGLAGGGFFFFSTQHLLPLVLLLLIALNGLYSGLLVQQAKLIGRLGRVGLGLVTTAGFLL